MQQIEIRLLRSWIGTPPAQRLNLQGLGLTRRETSVLRPDTAAIRGMVRKVLHLVEVRRASTQTAPARKVGAQVVGSPGTELEFAL